MLALHYGLGLGFWTMQEKRLRDREEGNCLINLRNNAYLALLISLLFSFHFGALQFPWMLVLSRDQAVMLHEHRDL